MITENQQGKEPLSKMQTRILDAAKYLFAKRGFKATTTRMIASEAGINEVTLFRNFKTKENILVQLINNSFLREENQGLKKCLEMEVREEKDVEEMLYQFGLAFFNTILVENKEIFFINLIELEERPEYSGMMSGNISRVLGMLVERLGDLYTQGVLANADFQIAALLYIQSLIGTFLMKYRVKSDYYPFTAEELCRKAASFLLHGICTRPAGPTELKLSS